MSTDQGGGAAPKDVSDVDSEKPNTVSHETYKRVLSEAKKAKEELSVFRAQKDADEQAKLAEQGKLGQLVESLQKELKAEKESSKNKERLFIQSNLKTTVKAYAKELGAIGEATEEIYEVAKAKGLLSSLEIKDDYSIDGEQIKNALSELSKKSPWFFKKEASGIKDVNIGGKQTAPEADVKKMSKDQLLAEYKKILQK